MILNFLNFNLWLNFPSLYIIFLNLIFLSILACTVIFYQMLLILVKAIFFFQKRFMLPVLVRVDDHFNSIRNWAELGLDCAFCNLVWGDRLPVWSENVHILSPFTSIFSSSRCLFTVIHTWIYYQIGCCKMMIFSLSFLHYL